LVVGVADESAYVGAYWGPRAEPVETCASRLRPFLTRLGGLHPRLAEWHTTVDNTSADAPPIQVDEDTLRELLSRGRNRTDFDGRIIEDLGYRVSLWNGREDDWECGIRVTCGVTATSVPNALVLDPPFPTPANGELFRPTTVRGMVEAAVESWAPERAKFITNGLDEKQEHLPPPQVGWLTYVTSEVPTAPPPTGATVSPFGDGYLVQIGSDPLSVSGAAVQRVREWLGIGVPDCPPERAPKPAAFRVRVRRRRRTALPRPGCQAHLVGTHDHRPRRTRGGLRRQARVWVDGLEVHRGPAAEAASRPPRLRQPPLGVPTRSEVPASAAVARPNASPAGRSAALRRRTGIAFSPGLGSRIVVGFARVSPGRPQQCAVG
jgi:hypothetical protein